jgi:hypothetical protein
LGYVTQLLRDCEEARPHPGLLPQEKENHLPHFGEVQLSGLAMRFSGASQAAATEIAIQKFTTSANALSLSPGQRAGVRASVGLSF